MPNDINLKKGHPKNGMLIEGTRYVIALFSIITAIVLLQWMMENVNNSVPHTSMFLCAVIFCTWFLGIRQGIFSIVLSLLAFSYFFLPPGHTLAILPNHIPRLVFFLIPSVFIVWLSAVQKKMRESLMTALKSQKDTVQKLVLKELKLKEAQAIANIGNWEICLESDTCTWSDEVFTIFGIESSQFQPSKEAFFSFIHPDDLAMVQGKIENIETNSTPINYFDFRFIKKNGEVRYGSSDARIELNDANTPVRIYGVIKDMTKHKMAEEKKDQTLRSIKEILFITSHKVRQPVANIIQISSLLDCADISKQELSEIVGHMKESAESLNTFTKELNDFVTQLHEKSVSSDAKSSDSLKG